MSFLLYFEDLLDTKLREFNPPSAEGEGPMLGQLRRSPPFAR